MSEASELIKACEDDSLLWGRMMFPEHFRSSSPNFHIHLMATADGDNKYIAIAAPRESAKTTLLDFTLPAHRICFKKKRFIVLCSNTFGKAAKNLQTIKEELINSAEIKTIHGKITLVKDAEGDAIFQMEDGWRTNVICKGYEQLPSIRGVKFGAWRPDLIICDDLEDDMMVQNPDRRRKLQDDYDTALVPAGDKELCQFIVIGTVLHDDALMSKLVNKKHYPEYRKLFYQGHVNPDTPEESSLWEYKWTIPYLKDLRKTKPHVYAKEIQNDPVAGGERRFHKEDFRYWSIANEEYQLLDEDNKVMFRGLLKDCKGAVACDLAWSQKRTADRSVLLPGLLTPDSHILLLEYIHEVGLRPDKVSDMIFMMVDRVEKMTGTFCPLGLEKAMLENVTKWILKDEMKARNKFINIKELVWDADKCSRIENRLIPRYSQHMIFHQTRMGDLEHQLLRFPHGSHDDIIDAEQGLVQMLQYPKRAKKDGEKHNEFNWWKKQSQKMFAPKEPNRLGTFRVNTPGKRSKLPSTLSWK